MLYSVSTQAEVQCSVAEKWVNVNISSVCKREALFFKHTHHVAGELEFRVQHPHVLEALSDTMAGVESHILK
jgi:hypothetical protein